MSVTLSYSEVEAVLANAFGVAALKRKAFAARLRQLQRLGLPRGANTGRGRHVTYSAWQLSQLQLYLDLMRAGLTPKLAESISKHPSFEVGNFWEAGEARESAGEPFYIFVGADTLGHLRDDHAADENSQAWTGITFRWTLEEIAKVASKRPGVVIDLAARLGALKAAIAKVVPEQANVRLFPVETDAGED